MYLLFLLWLCFAFVFVFGKLALSFFSIFDFIFLRMITAGTLLLFYELFFGDRFLSLRKKSLPKIENGSLLEKIPLPLLLILTSTMHMLIPFILEYKATLILHPTTISLLYSFSPFITAIISIGLKQEILTLNKALGLSLGWMATLFTFLPSINFNISGLIQLDSFNVIPEIILLGAIVSASLAWFLVKELMNRGLSLSLINGLTMFCAGIGIFVFKNYLSTSCNLCTTFFDIPWNGWALLATTTLLSNFIGYTLYSYLLNFYSATILSLSGFLCPIFTATVAHFLLAQNNFTGYYLLSFILGIIGLLIYEKKE